MATAETMFVHLLAANNLPLSMADSFSKMLGTMFPDSQIANKFSSGRMKMTQVIKWALAPAFHKV